MTGWRVRGWNPHQRHRSSDRYVCGPDFTPYPRQASVLGHADATELAAALDRTRHFGLRWSIEKESTQP